MILNAIKEIKNSFNKEPLTIEFDDNSAKDIIKNFNHMGLSAEAFAEETKLSEESMLSYLKTTDSGKATFTGYTNHVNETNKAIGLTGVKAKAASIGVGLLNAALTVGISLLAGFLIEKVISGLDDFIHYEEKLAEKSRNAKSFIDELKSSFDNLKTSTDDIKERYAELAQGVDQLNGKNLTLSDDDYVEFLDLSNQLSELFPSLTKNYDENGNAILDLSGDVNSIVSSLDALIKKEQEVANQKILEEMPDIYAELANNISNYNQELDKYKLLKESIPNNSDIDIFGRTSFGLNEPYFYDKDSIQSIKDKFKEKFEEYDINDADLKTTYNLDGALQFTISGLENTEEYRDKIVSIYKEIRADIIKEIQETNSSIQSEMNQFSEYIYTWLSSDIDYTGIDSEGLKTAIQELLFNSNWMNDLPDNIDSTKWSKELEEWLKSNYLDAIKNIGDEEYKQKLADLFTLDLSVQDKLDLANELQAYFDEHNIKISLDFITNGDNPNSAQNLADRMNMSQSTIASPGTDEYLRLKEYTQDFDAAQMNAWLTATQGATDADNAIRKYENSINRISNKNYNFFTEDNIGSIDEYKSKISGLGSYLTSLSANHKLSAEEMTSLNIEYGIVADSVEGYRLAIVNLMNDATANSNVMIALQEAINSCNDVATKDRLQSLYESLSNLNTEAQTSAESVYNLNDSISTLESSASLLRELDELMNTQGFIDTSRSNDILAVFPEMEEAVAKYNAGLIDSTELFDLLEQAYLDDETNYAKSIAIKNQYNDEYYDQWLENLPEWVRNMAESYGIDLENYANLNEQKLALDKEYTRRKAWLEAAQAKSAKLNEIAVNSPEGTQLRDQAAALDAVDDVIDIQDKVKEIEELINAIDSTFTVDTSWQEFGKGESGSGGGSGSDTESKTEIDWIDQSLKVLQESVDDAQTALDDTHGYDAQIEAITALNGALKKLKTGYKNAQTEYSDRYEGYLSKLPNGDKIRKYIESGKKIDLSSYDSDTAAIIQNAIDAYNNMIEAENKVSEIDEQIQDNNKLEKSKIRQTKYETQLAGVQLDLENDNLTASEKNELLKKQLDYQNKINNELIKQAEYEGDVLEVENLKKENKKNEKDEISQYWDNIIGENQSSIDAKNTLLESDKLTESQIDDAYGDIKDLTEDDYKYKFNKMIEQLDTDNTWTDYITDLKKQYGQENVKTKKFVKEHLQEIVEHFSYTGMEELYYEFLNSMDDLSDNDYETHSKTRSYYINDNNNQIANIQSDIDYAGGRGTEEQYLDMQDLHRENLGYWTEQKKEAQSFLDACTKGTAEWDEWNSKLQECNQNIKACERSIKDCNVSILSLPLNYIDDALKDIDNQLYTVNDQIDDYNTYVSAANFILDTQIREENKKKEVLEDQVTALEKANDVRNAELELQKSLYNLEKMRNQKTEKVFHEDTGWVFESNVDEVKKAQEDYDTAFYNNQVAGLNFQIKEHDENIKKLNRIKDEWSVITTNAQGSVDLSKAVAYDSDFFNKVLNGDTSLIEDIQNNMTSLVTSKDALEEEQEKYQELQDLINDIIEDYQLEAISYETANQKISAITQTYFPGLSSRYAVESGQLQDIIDKKKKDESVTSETSKNINKTVEESNKALLESYTTLQTDLSKIFENMNMMLQTYIDNTNKMVVAITYAVSQMQNQMNALSSLNASASVSIDSKSVSNSSNAKSNKSKVKTAGKSHSGLELGYIGENNLSQDKKDFKYLALSELKDDEIVRVLQRNEAVLTEGQLQNVMSNFRKLTQVKLPTITPYQTQGNSLEFNGDIIINNPVGDSSKLAREIKQNLGSQLLQQLYSNK